MSIITSPIFLQSASNIKREPEAYVSMQYNVANPILYAVSSNGKVKVQSTYQGQPKVETYASLSETQVSIQADANTEIKLIGKIIKIDSLHADGGTQGMISIDFVGQDELTYLSFGERGRYHTGLTSLYLQTNTALTYLNCSHTGLTSLNLQANTALTFLDCSGCPLTSLDLQANTALTSLNCSGCSGLTSLYLQTNTALTYLNCSSCPLTSLDLQANTALTSLNCISCTGLTSLDLQANTALTSLACYGCTGLTSLNLQANTALTFLDCDDCIGLTSLNLQANTALAELNCDNCTGLTTIHCVANNSSVSTAIAGAITNATATDGTVYVASTDTYYSTIETAATTKGWTIEEPQA